jgi:hypothetical protein
MFRRSPQTLKNVFIAISATDCRLLESLVFAYTFKKSLFLFALHMKPDIFVSGCLCSC